MVSGSRIEGGGTQILSASVKKTICFIKEIVGNHSDAEIYVTLKETNMDPNETIQKLLNQDPFHEVKRKRDKKKEGAGYKGAIVEEPRKPPERVVQGMKFNNFPDRNIRRGSYNRNTLSGVTREFRVVRDNRINQNSDTEIKPPPRSSAPLNEELISNASEKGSSGTSKNQKPPVARQLPQSLNGPTGSYSRQSRDASLNGSDRKDSIDDKRPLVNATPLVQAMKPNVPQPHSVTSPSSSVVGVYSSSSDPVHVPSLDSRPAGNVGAIRREVGAVGVRRQTSENSSKMSSVQGSSVPNSHLGRDGTPREPLQSFSSISGGDQPAQSNATESSVPNMASNRSFMNNQYGNRPHQQVLAHQKAPQANKEWKRKSSPKPSVVDPGVIGTPTKSVSSSSATNNSKDLTTEAAQVQDELSRANIHENENVIIAAHIRVSETDRCRLTFGSLGTEAEPSPKHQEVGGAVELSVEPSAPESSGDETSASKQVESIDERVRSSASISPASGAGSEQQLADTRESTSPQNMENFADIGLGSHSSPSYAPESQQPQQQDAPEIPSFSEYDPQTGYDLPYFRPAVDESIRSQVLPISQEALSSHAANSIPASTIAMVQQQGPVAQMYPQVHLSHFANLMPYRQFLSPVYVPPMPMPGYSNSPTYSPHPPSGSSYLLMPGANSPHLTANGLKYGIQQYKPVPTGSPTGFGNFTSPTGYAINAPGVVGSAAGLDDSSRLKYKDGNLYVPNPQAETSELWMNPRDIPSMQSASYYNMPGQTPHAAYMPSHTGHTSFNAAAQSSHMQFPGLYHPPQPGTIANPHHMGPTMGGNVGVATAAPGPQVGPYQQPQLGHMNWTANF